jgi:hypothetical protein
MEPEAEVRKRQKTRIPAKHEGVCGICWDEIEPGEWIVHSGREGWVHEDCGAEEFENDRV